MSDLESGLPQHKASSESALLRGAGATLGGTAVGGAIAFCNEILIARYMGASQYGLFALAFVLARIGTGVASFGLGAAVLHYLPIHSRRREAARIVGTVYGAVLLPAVLSCLAVTLLWMLAPWLATDVFHKPEAARYIRLLALAIPAMSMSEILALITRGLGFSRYYVLISNLSPPLAQMVFLWLIRIRQADSVWVSGAVVGAYSASALVGLVFVARTVGPDLWRFRPDLKVGALYRYAFPVLLGTCLYLVMEWADILILGRFVAADQVGIYRACIQICVIFDMIILATNLAAAHIFPVLEHEQRTEERNETYRHVTLLVVLLSAPVFFLLSLHARETLALLGPNFAGGATVLIILAGGRLIRNGLGTSAFLLVLSGRQRVETKNAAAAATTNIVLNLALIPVLGVLGAAIGTTFAEVALNLLRIWQIRKLMDVHVPWRLLARIAAVGIGVAIVVGAATSILGIEHARPMALLINAIVAGGLFAVAFWFLGVENRDRMTIIKAFQYNA